MNVIALAGIPGISFLPVTHGLGALPETAVNPLLQLGGADAEEWWQKRSVEAQDVYVPGLGYVRRGYGFEGDVAWELGDEPYGIGRPITMAQFTDRMTTQLHAEAKRGLFGNIAIELAREDQADAEARRHVVRVTLTAAGVTYSVLKVLPLL
jgi:hypothetical protein